jgi:hypothetical protein
MNDSIKRKNVNQLIAMVVEPLLKRKSVNTAALHIRHQKRRIKMTRQDVREAFLRGKEDYDFMLIVCDTFDYEDYPVFCMESEYSERFNHYDGKNMQKIMESYNLKMDMEAQLGRSRCMQKQIGLYK